MKHPLVIGLALVVALGLAGCSGSRSGGRDVGVRSASGPISTACNRSDRRSSSPRLCGCIQQVANRSLSRSDQSLAASFFSNPQRAQDVRQSDRLSNEAFWKRYKAFGADAQRYCSAVS